MTVALSFGITAMPLSFAGSHNLRGVVCMSPFTLIFVALAAGGFYLLIHEEKVRSRLALRWVWIDLGLALMTTAVAHVLSAQRLAARPGFRTVASFLTSEAIGFLFLGAACIAMMLTVHPMRRNGDHGAHARRTSRRLAVAPSAPPAWIEHHPDDQAAAEGDQAIPPDPAPPGATP